MGEGGGGCVRFCARAHHKRRTALESTRHGMARAASKAPHCKKGTGADAIPCRLFARRLLHSRPSRSNASATSVHHAHAVHACAMYRRAESHQMVLSLYQYTHYGTEGLWCVGATLTQPSSDARHLLAQTSIAVALLLQPGNSLGPPSGPSHTPPE